MRAVVPRAWDVAWQSCTPDSIHADSLHGDQVCDVEFRKRETAAVVLGHWAVIGARMMTPDVYVFLYRAYEVLFTTLMTNICHIVCLFSTTSSPNRGGLRLNLSSQRGSQKVRIEPGASDAPELVVLCPYK